MQRPIYTEKTECRDCYKCVRSCPVKAIRVENGSAVVLHDLCIYCGRCVDVCPVHAKRIRNDIPVAVRLLESRKRVFVSLAPSFSSEFTYPPERLIAALKLLGFAGVSETALGAETVSRRTTELLKVFKPEPMLSTACPVIVEMVTKYHPKLCSSLSPLYSPLGMHARMLKRIFGPDIGVVFIGPCIAKKLEADRESGIIDCALTFKELSSWLESEEIDPVSLSPDGEGFVPCQAVSGTYYPVEGGMIRTLELGDTLSPGDMVSFSGVPTVAESLKELEVLSIRSTEGHEKPWSHPTSIPSFIELLACEGGCIQGSSCERKVSPVMRKASSLSFSRERSTVRTVPDAQSPELLNDSVFPVERKYYHSTGVIGKEDFSEEAIRTALIRLGKKTERDILDCGGCGYNSCRDFAVAFLSGMAEKEMCVTNMRKLAQRKVDMLLRALPMGVVIADSELSVVDCNREFLSLFSDGAYTPDDELLRRMEGLPLERFLPFVDRFRTFFSGDQSVFQERIKHEERFIELTLFSIDRDHLAGGIFQDVTCPTIKRETVIRKAEAVIRRNLESVQQIASLLGENAAETEIILTSLIEAFRSPQEALSRE